MSITSVDRAALVERLSARLSVVGLIPFLLVLVVIGMALVVSDAAAARAILEAEGETVFDIGRIEAAEGEPQVEIKLPDGWPA